MNLPRKLRRAPRRLKEVVNGIIDWLFINTIILGPGLKETQTTRGRLISVSDAILKVEEEATDPNNPVRIPPVPSTGYWVLTAQNGQLVWQDSFECVEEEE